MARLPAVLLAAAFLLLYAIAGQWDYEEARSQECADKGLGYNYLKDKCYGKTEEN